MKEKEILAMQRRIDEDIRQPQSRLLQRASAARQSLVVCRNGKILELVPDVEQNMTEGSSGDPLARRKQR